MRKRVLHITSSYMPPKKNKDFDFIKVKYGASNKWTGKGYEGGRVGGLASVISDYGIHLEDYDTHVLLPQDGQPCNFTGHIDVDKRDNVTIHYFPCEGTLSHLKKVKYTLSGILSNAYPDFQFDIVVTHVVDPHQDLSKVDKKVRWINVSHGSATNSKLSDEYLDLMDSFVLMSTQQLATAPKQALNDLAISVEGPRLIQILAHPIDTNIYKPYHKKRDDDAVWHGRISPEKQILPFSTVFNGVFPEKKLHIIGGPDHPVHLANWERPPNTQLHGRLYEKELGKELSKHNYYVLPSQYETFCVALLEALACGCDVYALNSARIERIGGIKWAEDVVTFSDSYDDICNQIINSNSLRNELTLTERQERNIQFVKDNYSWDVLKSQYYNIWGGNL